MPRVRFTPALVRQAQAADCDVPGHTAAEVLQNVFSAQPALRSYVLDDQGALRKHVAVFVDGACVTDRQTLADAVQPSSEIFVMQSLSGG